MSEISSTKVVTPTAVLSYPHLHQPQPAQDGKKPKYSCALIFPAGSDLSALEKAAFAAAEAKYPGKGADMLKKGQLKNPFRKTSEKDEYDKLFPGGTFINVRTEQKPAIVYSYAGEDGKPARMPDEKVKEEMYPGVKVRASLAAFAYDTSGNKGVSFALNNLQKLAEGDRIDGRVAAEDEFDVDLSQAPADLGSLV